MGINKENSVIILKDIWLMRLNLWIVLSVLLFPDYRDDGTKGYYQLVITLLKRASWICRRFFGY